VPERLRVAPGRPGVDGVPGTAGVLEVWRQGAATVTGRALPCDHYLPEQARRRTTEALLASVRAGLTLNDCGCRHSRQVMTRNITTPLGDHPRASRLTDSGPAGVCWRPP
jgi:hypothetical protein